MKKQIKIVGSYSIFELNKLANIRNAEFICLLCSIFIIIHIPLVLYRLAVQKVQDRQHLPKI